VIDEEHAPFDRAFADVVVLAARRSNLASIVRVSACWCRMSHRLRKREPLLPFPGTAADAGGILDRRALAVMALRRCGNWSKSRTRRYA
jgi:hypothetical protein